MPAVAREVNLVLHWMPMKSYIHARLSEEDREVLKQLRAATGEGESELVRKGLRLVLKELRRERSALDLAGDSVGKFGKAPKDLARNKTHLAGFGK
jgi:hypothetical protein